ncbi:hypothetical protein L596_014051 [Steinernema carpocapsae]|uniref:Uncharacterized protein n=1 Tax=Steinernema carpocapsae TaxID=34508 RepID=A0A4U5NAA0_STECR|nr:hypothetical protein L596_014051 [Steinernema carpocapsae]
MDASDRINVLLDGEYAKMSGFLCGTIAYALLTIFIICISYRLAVYSIQMHRFYKSLRSTSINPSSYSFVQPKQPGDEDLSGPNFGISLLNDVFSDLSDNEIDDELEFYQEDEYDNPLMRKFIRETIAAIERRKRIDRLRDAGVLPERPNEFFIDDFIDLSVYEHVDLKSVGDDFDKDGKLLKKAIAKCQENYKEVLMTLHLKSKRASTQTQQETTEYEKVGTVEKSDEKK